MLKYTHSIVSLLAAILWFSISVVDVIKDVPLTIHQQRLSCHTYKKKKKHIK